MRARASPRQKIGTLEFPEADLKFQARRAYRRDCALLHRTWITSRQASLPRICGVDPAELRPPLILATFHIGTLEAMGALCERLPGHVLVLRTGRAPRRRGVTTVNVHGGEWARVRAIKMALDALRAGGFVFLPVDWQGNAQVEATLFDRRVSLPKGAFALARMASAPILPVTGRWHGRKIKVVFGDPIPPGDEFEMAEALTQWLEGYLRENPRELTWPIVELLQRAG